MMIKLFLFVTETAVSIRNNFIIIGCYNGSSLRGINIAFLMAKLSAMTAVVPMASLWCDNK